LYMKQDITHISEQFEFKPFVENESAATSYESFVVCGMGGSHLSAGLMKIYNPELNIYIHRDYGLPTISKERFSKSLFVASSYSGNTEEVIDFANEACKAGYALAIISTGGALIEFAKEHSLPFILMPKTGAQPRNALGFSFVSLAKFIGGDKAVGEIQELAQKLQPGEIENQGKRLAASLKNKVPIIYSSRANQALAYSWKIKFNETTKIPAFHNIFPELNHNEMTGFDFISSTKDLSAKFHFIFLKDTHDHPKVLARMDVLKGQYEDRGFLVEVVDMVGQNKFEKIYNTIALADWTVYALAEKYGTDPEQVPMIEEFKKLIS